MTPFRLFDLRLTVRFAELGATFLRRPRTHAGGLGRSRVLYYVEDNGVEERYAGDIQRSVSRAACGGFLARLAAERYRAVERGLIW
jgi:hypothetical protein